MGVVITSGLVVSSTSGGGTIDGNNPIIGYETRVTTGNISATTEADGFPAENMANPSTNLRWVGEVSSPAADEYITLALNTAEDVDYVAIARHNLGSAQIPISIEKLDPDASPEAWDEIVTETLLPDDGPAIFRFTPQGISSLRLRLQPGSAAPTIAVVYAGKLLVIQRRLYVGHRPMKLNRKTRVTNAHSENGNFLGRVVLSVSTATQVALQNLTPDWYRASLDPFVQAARESPFFFAWRPGDYPYEVAYGWLTSDPQPSNQRPNGMMQVSFDIGGILQ